MSLVKVYRLVDDFLVLVDCSDADFEEVVPKLLGTFREHLHPLELIARDIFL